MKPTKPERTHHPSTRRKPPRQDDIVRKFTAATDVGMPPIPAAAIKRDLSRHTNKTVNSSLSPLIDPAASFTATRAQKAKLREWRWLLDVQVEPEPHRLPDGESVILGGFVHQLSERKLKPAPIKSGDRYIGSVGRRLTSFALVLDNEAYSCVVMPDQPQRKLASRSKLAEGALMFVIAVKDGDRYKVKRIDTPEGVMCDGS